MQKGISVIVCCYNSSARLPETIRHLALQQVSHDIPWEIIVINNASTDSTQEIAINEWRKYSASASLCVVDEQKPGIIYAREKGVKAAQYEYIIFCDDDNWLKSDYLDCSYRIMEALPYVGALGGQGEIVTDGILPDWWEKEKNSFAVGTQAAQNGDVTKRGYLWGSGIVSRKSILEHVFDHRYPFLLTGRRKDIIASGDDAELCSRIILIGWKLYYHKDLHYKHFISKERLTGNYRESLIYGFRLTYLIQSKYKLAIEYMNSPLHTKLTNLIKRSFHFKRLKFEISNYELFKGYLLFALGLKLTNDEDFISIYNFIKRK